MYLKDNEVDLTYVYCHVCNEVVEVLVHGDDRDDSLVCKCGGSILVYKS